LLPFDEINGVAPFGASAPLGTVPQFAIVIPAPDCALLYGNIKATQPPRPTGFAQIVSDDFPVLHDADSAGFALHTAAKGGVSSKALRLPITRNNIITEIAKKLVVDPHAE
jgi:hypothetical protein